MRERLKDYITENNLDYNYEMIWYAIEIILFNIITISICLFISVMMDEFIFGIFFIILFAILRIKYGGFHCKKPITCILTMICVFSLVIHIKNNYLFISNYLTLCIVNIFLFVSIQFKEKDFKGIIFLLFCLSAYFVFYYTNLLSDNLMLAILFSVMIFDIFYCYKYFRNTLKCDSENRLN